jgi:hypothetical protein
MAVRRFQRGGHHHAPRAGVAERDPAVLPGQDGLGEAERARDRVQLVIIAYDAGLVAPAR